MSEPVGKSPYESPYVTNERLSLELRAFRAEMRLMLVSVVAAGAVLNLAPTDILKSAGALGVMALGLAAKVVLIGRG